MKLALRDRMSVVRQGVYTSCESPSPPMKLQVRKACVEISSIEILVNDIRGRISQYILDRESCPTAVTLVLQVR